MLHSVSPLRHAFYETFLHLHIIMAVLSFVGLWVHLEGLEAQKYLLVAIIFWALEVRGIPFSRCDANWKLITQD